MGEATRTIAVRVPAEVAAEIEDLAKACGQSKSDWIRDQIMPAIHGAGTPSADSSVEPTPAASAMTFTDLVQTALKQRDIELKAELESIRQAINQSAKAHHDDLALIAEVGEAVEKTMRDMLVDARNQVLGAINRLEETHTSLVHHREQQPRRRGGY